MAAAGITALLKKMDYHDVVVAIDGSVFRYHPHFPNIMRSRDEREERWTDSRELNS